MRELLKCHQVTKTSNYFIYIVNQYYSAATLECSKIIIVAM